MDMPPVSIPIQLDAAGHIDADAPCTNCGYNLRGLSASGVCPECATGIDRSLQGNRLCFSPPAWVDKLASGMIWLFAAVLFWLFTFCLEMALFPGPRAGGTGKVALQAVGILGVIGYWRLATPEPAQIDRETTFSLRRLVRMAAIAKFASGFALEWGEGSAQPPVLVLLIVLEMMLAVAGYATVFSYARGLALRLPDRRLAAHTRFVMWGVVVVVAWLMIMMAVSRATGPRPASSAEIWILVVPVEVGVCVFIIWSLVLLSKYHRAFTVAASQARRSWSGQPGDRSAASSP